MSWLVAASIARVLVTNDVTLPDVQDDAVLLIKRHDVVVGCTTGDAGIGGDASISSDGGMDAGTTDAPVDAAVSDASVNDGGLDDGGTTDAGSGCTLIPGDAITMIVQPHVHSTRIPQNFAMLYVTPSRPVVEVFNDALGSLPSITAPNVIVHYVDVVDPSLGSKCAGDVDVGGCGGGGGGCAPTTWDPPGYGGQVDDGGVHLEMVGPYEILRVQPRDRTELMRWLDTLGFVYDDDDLAAVVPYLARGYYVVAARLAAMREDLQTTSLAMTWASSEPSIPAALSAARDPSTPLTVYVAGDGTYGFTGGKITFSGRVSMSMMGTTYVTRSELTLANIHSPADDPIAFRLIPDLVYTETVEETRENHVPPIVDCDTEDNTSYQSDRGGCCSDCNTHRRVRLDMIVLALAVMYVVRRKRR